MRACETDCALRHTVETGKPIVNKSAFIVNADDRRISVSGSTAILHNERGEIVGGAETFRALRLVEELQKVLEGRCQRHDLVNRSVALRRICDLLPQIAPSEATVLMLGDPRGCSNTGTTKSRPRTRWACTRTTI